jgi:hypothetical protein
MLLLWVVGSRPAYPLQVFAVLEEHSDFENVGFHWHLLVKGVDFLPNQVVSDALRSATGGRRVYSRRVISIWSYQRGQLRLVS